MVRQCGPRDLASQVAGADADPRNPMRARPLRQVL